MTDSDLTPSSTWTGDFTSDGLFLRKHIKTVKHDYNQQDPRTWPLIREISSTDNGIDYRKSRSVPAFLAYEQSLISDCI